MSDKWNAFRVFVIGLLTAISLIFINLFMDENMKVLSWKKIVVFIIWLFIFITFVLLMLGIIPKTWFFEELKEKEHCFFLYDSSNNNEIIKEKFEADSLIVLPTSTKKIESGSFSEYPNLKQIYFLNPDIEICEGAFAGCYKLEEVHLPNHLSEIEAYTFAMCKNLKMVYIPESVSNIQNNSFLNCNGEILLCFEGSIKNWAIIIKDFGRWGISDSCKIKFRNWESEKTIKEYLKEEFNQKN